MKRLVLVCVAVVLVAGGLLRAAEEAPPPPPPPLPADAKPAEAKPADAKPVEAKPAIVKPLRAKAVPDEENWCILCHANLTEKDQVRFLVAPESFAHDIHWQKGLRCQDCHGGDPTIGEQKAHQANEDFRTVKSPKDVPEFCGTCHSNIEYMRQFKPSPRTDQLAEYWTSGHGQRLKQGDLATATCTSCHGKPHGSAADPKPHGVRTVDDLQSPVYRTRVAQTCARCHSDEKLMAGRQYHGRPLGHDQYAKWKKSVHGEAMLVKGDLSAPTCNNCHGNHGALPPEIGSVANACGSCHGKVAKLFEGTRMRHKFEEDKLPGCATCHHAHDIQKPTDAMLGMEAGAVCADCHAKAKLAGGTAPLAMGAQAAAKLRAELDGLNRGIATAKETLAEAERLGMEVSQPRFDLRKANDALTNARSLIHSFVALSVEGEQTPAEKLQVLDKSLEQAKAKVQELEKAVAEAKAKGDKAAQDAAAEALKKAKDAENALTSARPLAAALAEGYQVVAAVQQKADEALEEHAFRRVWLAASLAPIFLVIVLLVAYIRTLPPPKPAEPH